MSPRFARPYRFTLTLSPLSQLSDTRGVIPPLKAENFRRLRALNALAASYGDILLDLNDSNVYLAADGLLRIIDCNFLPGWLRWTLGVTSADRELGDGLGNLYGQGHWIGSDLPPTI